MKRFTQQDLDKILEKQSYSIGTAAYYPHASPAPAGLPHPLPEPDALLLPLGQDKDEGGGPKRIVVRLERRGTRILDADNAAGACKFLLDACRYENLIPDDDPEAIELIVTQKKVAKGETETVVQITYP